MACKNPSSWRTSGFFLSLAALFAAAIFLPVAAHSDQIDGDRIVIVDGDTIALPCAVRRSGFAEKVRLVDINTPETFRPRCERELSLGLEAKQRHAELLRGHRVEIARSGKKDRYGRTLATLKVAGVDVGAALVEEGHAVRYRPGAEARLVRLRSWCVPAATLDDRWKHS